MIKQKKKTKKPLKCANKHRHKHKHTIRALTMAGQKKIKTRKSQRKSS